jgi:hypothetical protein
MISWEYFSSLHILTHPSPLPGGDDAFSTLRMDFEIVCILLHQLHFVTNDNHSKRHGENILKSADNPLLGGERKGWVI